MFQNWRESDKIPKSKKAVKVSKEVKKIEE